MAPLRPFLVQLIGSSPSLMRTALLSCSVLDVSWKPRPLARVSPLAFPSLWVSVAIQAHVLPCLWPTVFPEGTTFQDCQDWLLNNSWSDVSDLKRYVRRQGKTRSVSFRYKGRHPEGVRDAWCLECPVAGSTPVFISVAPWRSTSRPLSATSLKQRGLDAEKHSSSAVPKNSAKVNTCGVKRKSEDGVTDLVEPAIASDGGAAVLAKLGVTQNAALRTVTVFITPWRPSEKAQQITN